MKTILKCTILAIILVGCRGLSLNEVPDDLIIDDELRPYLQTFLEKGKFYLDKDFMPQGIFVVTLSDVENKSAVAYCKRINTFYKAVIVDKHRWSYSTDEEKMFTMAHEFGHCLLNLDHDSYGFMTPSIQADYDEGAYWEHLFRHIINVQYNDGLIGTRPQNLTCEHD